METCDPDRLAELVRSGDPEALAAITRCYSDKLVAIGRRTCGDAVLAEDAVQDALLSASQHLHDWRGEGRIDAWLGRMVANACWKMKRGRKNDPHLHAVDIELPDPDHDPEMLAARGELVETITDALATLDPRDRALVLLSDVDGFKGPELAERLDISPAAARKRLSRARKRLRDELTERLPA